MRPIEVQKKGEQYESKGFHLTETDQVPQSEYFGQRQKPLAVPQPTRGQYPPREKEEERKFEQRIQTMLNKYENRESEEARKRGGRERRIERVPDSEREMEENRGEGREERERRNRGCQAERVMETERWGEGRGREKKGKERKQRDGPKN